VRPLSWHPTKPEQPKEVRRAIVTFPYAFKSVAPVHFSFHPAKPNTNKRSHFEADFDIKEDTLLVKYRHGPILTLRLLAPARASGGSTHREIVEANSFYRWERFHLSDTDWPRVIEVRVDALGEVIVVGHLQRNLPGDGRAPDFGWEVAGIPARGFDKYCRYQPVAPLRKRGRVEEQRTKNGDMLYRYWRCTAEEQVPMQSTAWHRVELVIAPKKLGRVTPTLLSPHRVEVSTRLWDELYSIGSPLEIKTEPELTALLEYHHNAIVRSMAQRDDMGNLTSYTDGQTNGSVFGMNRLNHCPPIFQEAWRTGDRRLLETAVLWCENFYDQSIWWGAKQRGGTRYNNIIATGKTPPDNDKTYMWRSNDSVNFCTKGYDTFWLAYEETGDPRMLEALDAQVAYAKEHVHADRGECRNIGDVREFVRLYHYTGREEYLDQALRLFRELRTKLSTGDLFDQGGKALTADAPFIDDDEAGLRIGYAKPYIIGYALAGLPELAPFAPSEPKLREVIAAVADFIAESEDLIGGWRYPHPRSTYVIVSQGIEHAWQLVQADRFLGAQEKHLDAIERVLRQRILGWEHTGKIFAGLSGWELASGKIKNRAELYQLYKKPDDRDFMRDYQQGEAGFGSSAPEGLVYFPEVLGFYLKHRPASRLLAAPKPDEPLGQVLARVPKKGVN
jgi:hypothetical protein